jgi:hypothetical protein
MRLIGPKKNPFPERFFKHHYLLAGTGPGQIKLSKLYKLIGFDRLQWERCPRQQVKAGA